MTESCINAVISISPEARRGEIFSKKQISPIDEMTIN